MCTTVCNLTLIYNFLRTALYFWLNYQLINCVDNMSIHNAEPFENLLDFISILAEDSSNLGGEPSTGIDSTEGRVREARLRRRDLQKRIQACTDRLLAFETEEEILLFEENEVKNRDWEIRDFFKNGTRVKGDGATLGTREKGGGRV